MSDPKGQNQRLKAHPKPMLTQIHKPNEEVRPNEQSFCQLAESIGAVFWMTDTAKTRMVYVSPGYEKVWGRSCASLYDNAAEWLASVHPEDRSRVAEAALTAQIAGDYDEEYRIIRPDGAIRWIHDRAFPVRDTSGEVFRIAGIAEDITERKRLEQEVIEMSDREQCRLGQHLHDGICQQLVSIAFATDLLRRDLVAKSPPEAVRVARITALLDNAITQARNLSHALCPVNLTGNGLGIALRELATSMSRGSQVVCEVDCAEGILVRDHAVATHLYRIAQEAVQNAIKHAEATRVLIALFQEGQNIHLRVSDNGRKALSSDGQVFETGLNIMRYRAGMAGGGLEVELDPEGGTTISCYFQQKGD
jgi:PAS domain S-box-containing protein